tara:strand:- start:987 stop:1433 length:447 start_codon:yes stop_codon:yes gene_type:complete
MKYWFFSSGGRVLAITILGILFGLLAMSSSKGSLRLNWEWPAEREPDQKILVHIEHIKAPDSGFLGIGRSPSLVNSYPDPVVVTGVVVKAEELSIGKNISIMMPRLELNDLDVRDYAVLGVVDGETCICITRVSGDDVDLDSVSCTSE